MSISKGRNNPTQKHINEFAEILNGFWEREIWDVRECHLIKGEWPYTNKVILFNKIQQPYIRKELQYYFAKRILSDEYTIRTVFLLYGSITHRLADFLLKKMPTLFSIVDIPKQKLLLQWQSYLSENNLKTSASLKKYNKVYKRKSKAVYLVNAIYDFFVEFYDDRLETDKDRWDVRKLGISYNESQSSYHLDFSLIPFEFRELVKKYVSHRMFKQEELAFNTCRDHVFKLSHFFTFINQKHPNWTNLVNLQREDVEDYICYLRKIQIKGKTPRNTFIVQALSKISTFIKIVQRFEWEDAPTFPAYSLIYSDDYPKLDIRNTEDVVYIPDEVWEQVLDNIHHFPKEYIPIVLVMEASGFRISDVLLLKMNCLLETDNGWWLIGDQRKVKYKDHKVPISNEVASIIQGQLEIMLELSTKENNPKNYLFANLRGKRRGKPVAAQTISSNLNSFAQKCNIVNKNGKIFRFNNHAFRHRYGVALVNNGMNITVVQQLMAHASPEMTCVYARILDDTKRKEWEKARDSGAFHAIRLHISGKVVSTSFDQHAQENGLELEWIRHNFDSIRLDHGFCVKSPKLKCDYLDQTLEPPCIRNNCRSFHVDQTFLPFYEDQILKMKSDIELYKRSGRTRSIELILPKLKKYEQILEGLSSHHGGIFGLDKARREYDVKEREKVISNGE
ncbi:tyrosine-type recombinase/integrase [Brevibacillus brevis]|nr:tyrosine-type recombinase/integrase [Brevibacillus brevis]